ncbi:probable G-protein coupled receptor B0563.6 isoform X2 [Artemia franciscana]|uniref:probable G-protein coupled receptor B0563.6 isoform X2 n=1 Tax=Artemia franciscana TaxID=6661 RepID=UPI0032DB7F8B
MNQHRIMDPEFPKIRFFSKTLSTTNLSNGVNSETPTIYNHTVQYEYDIDGRADILTYVTLTIIPFILVAGLAGNIITLIIFYKPQSQFRSLLGYYFSKLATADLIVILLWIPLFIRMIGVFDNVTGSILLAIYYAHLEIPLLNAAMGTSIFIVVALTIDRYISACRPHYFKIVHTKKNALRSVIIATALSVLLSAPLCLLKKFHESPDGFYIVSERRAVTSQLSWHIFVFSSEILVRVIPIILLTVLNACILRKFTKLSKRRIDLKGSASAMAASDYQRERRYFLMLSGVVAIFLITTLPSAIMAIIYSEDLEKYFSFLVFKNVTNVLEVCNFASNFYLYILCSPEVRKIFQKRFRCNSSLISSETSGETNP